MEITKNKVVRQQSVRFLKWRGYSLHVFWLPLKWENFSTKSVKKHLNGIKGIVIGFPVSRSQLT